MKSTRISRREVLKAAGVTSAVVAALGPNAIIASADETTVRWDIVSINFANGEVSAGGIASARAEDHSKITLTGSGTFTPGEDDQVTGGGTWKTFDHDGAQTGMGSYRVTRFVEWHVAPGMFPGFLKDTIGGGRPSPGLAVLNIRYNDRSTGVLVVSCELAGSPHSVFEGITVSKDFVDYWEREAPPAPPGNANRTLFHVREDD